MLLKCRRRAGRDEPEDLRGDLMDSAQGATPHQPAASPATDRATVYMETSRSARSRVVTRQRLDGNTLADDLRSVISQWAPASRSTNSPSCPLAT